MRNIRKTGAVLATAGLAALGAVAGPGGPADAATNMAMSGCQLDSASIIAAGTSPTCAAGTSTIYHPTGITVTVDPSSLTVLLGNSIINTLLGGALSETVSYSLSCSRTSR